MPTIPNSGKVNLASDVSLRSQPSLTFLVDPKTKTITGKADEFAVMRQAVEIILSVQRFRWQIYSGNFGMDYRNLIGNDPGFVASNLLRRLQDAFSTDDRVRGIENFTYVVEGSTLTASFTVKTVYGDLEQTEEVILN